MRSNMNKHEHPLARFSHFLHRNFIWFLLGSYVAAAVVPQAGLAIRRVSLGHVHLLGEQMPMLLLALLLLNAGLGVKMGQLRHLLRQPWRLLAGLAANLSACA